MGGPDPFDVHPWVRAVLSNYLVIAVLALLCLAVILPLAVLTDLWWRASAAAHWRTRHLRYGVPIPRKWWQP
jgi:hypothetical protein